MSGWIRTELGCRERVGSGQREKSREERTRDEKSGLRGLVRSEKSE